MNDAQRAVLLATAAILLIALLFPPFTIPYAPGSPRNMGYAFIFTPPVILESKTHPMYASVNVSLMAVEYLILATVGVFLFAAIKAR
jgi:hypothetical protein